MTNHLSVITIWLLVTLVFFLQVTLHTQMLQRRSELGASGDLSSDSKSEGEEISHTTNPNGEPPSSAILSAIHSNLRNKRFLQRPRPANINDNDAEATENKDSVENLNESDSASSVDHSYKKDKDLWDGVSSNLMIERFYTGNFIESNFNLCRAKRDTINLVVLVPSAIPNFLQRDSVRKTWGSFSLRKDVVIGFMVGNPQLSQANETVLESFRNEIDIFGDIIIADMKDSYQNLTLKVLYMLEWTSAYCSEAKFFMKTDDDVFLNVPLVLQFISKIQDRDFGRPKIYGNVFEGHMPQRNSTHKHHVGYKIYPHDIGYPRFTSGPSYLINSKVLKPLLKRAVQLPLFNLEDVFLTGFVAASLDIPRINVTQFRNELENPFDMSACRLINTIAGMTDGSSTQIYHVWYNYLMGRYLCKYLRPR